MSREPRVWIFGPSASPPLGTIRTGPWFADMPLISRCSHSPTYFASRCVTGGWCIRDDRRPFALPEHSTTVDSSPNGQASTMP